MELRTTQATRQNAFILLFAFALTIGSFVAASIVAELSERGIHEAADGIVHHTSPSMSHLSGLLASLRRLQIELEKATDAIPRGPTVDRSAIARAHGQVLDEWRAYMATPAFADELPLRPEISESLAALSERVGRVEPGADVGEAIDGIASSVARLRAVEVAAENRLAARIGTLREHALALALGLGLISLILGSVAAVYALRVVRQNTTLLVHRVDDLEAFAGRLAHEIKSPLTSASLSLDLLRLNAGETRAVLPIVERARRSIARVSITVDALLAFARAGAGSAPGLEADVPTIVREVLDELRQFAEERQIQLAAEVDACRLTCSPGLLWTLLTNLVGNALKHMGPSPLRCVTVRVRAVHDAVRIEVEDTGPGIGPELRQRIFNPFVRAPDATEPGIGLGLATVRRVVEAHGGRVGVESQPSHGSSFWLVLPRADRERRRTRLEHRRRAPAAQ
jgi:signal transduction histidine kinase